MIPDGVETEALTSSTTSSFFTAAAIKIQLASRAKKAKRKVEERRLRNLELQKQQEAQDEAEAFEAVLEGYDAAAEA